MRILKCNVLPTYDRQGYPRVIPTKESKIKLLKALLPAALIALLTRGHARIYELILTHCQALRRSTRIPPRWEDQTIQIVSTLSP
jgi:hypothetical protein